MAKFIMDRLKIYTPGEIFPLINERIGEVKLGQRVQFKWAVHF